MFKRILSNDLPRSRPLTLCLLLIIAVLVIEPFLFHSEKATAVAAKVLVFILLAASYDLVLGYTGIVSFAHSVFFGVGAYGIALPAVYVGPSALAMLAGFICACVISALIAFLIGLFSLRVKAIFYAMITLAVAASTQTLVSQMSEITGGEDGVTFNVPAVLSASFEPFHQPIWGIVINGRVITYYLVLLIVLVSFLILLRIVNSPFGRVLQAIRENEFRAEALGFSVVRYRVAGTVISALFATAAGGVLALWLRYVGPDTTLGSEVMLDLLLIVVIGGMGTLYGAVIGAALLVIVQNYLQDLLAIGANLTADVPLLGQLASPDRWSLWLGLLFILCVYYFPSGVVGRLRLRRRSSDVG